MVLEVTQLVSAQSQDLNLSRVAPEPALLTTKLCCLQCGQWVMLPILFSGDASAHMSPFRKLTTVTETRERYSCSGLGVLSYKLVFITWFKIEIVKQKVYSENFHSHSCLIHSISPVLYFCQFLYILPVLLYILINKINEYIYMHTGIPCFITLCRYCIFYKLKVCGNPALSDDSQHFLAIKYFKLKCICFQT